MNKIATFKIDVPKAAKTLNKFTGDQNDWHPDFVA